MTNRRARILTAIIPMLLAVLPFLNSLSNPRLASAHGADRLQLIAVGLCVGVGVGILLGAARFRD